MPVAACVSPSLGQTTPEGTSREKNQHLPPSLSFHELITPLNISYGHQNCSVACWLSSGGNPRGMVAPQARELNWVILVPALLLQLRNVLRRHLEGDQSRPLHHPAKHLKSNHNPQYKLTGPQYKPGTGTGSNRDAKSITQQACSSSGMQARGFPATDQLLTTTEYLVLPLSTAPECCEEEGMPAPGKAPCCSLMACS